MKQDQLLSFFRHISAREQTHGIKNAFRFKSVLSGRKKGFLLSARYGAGAGAGAAGPSFVATTSQQETHPETIEPGTLGPAAVGLAPLDPAGGSSAGAGAADTSIVVATQQVTRPEKELSTSGPATVGLAPLVPAGAGAGGSPLVATTQQETQLETVDPLKSVPVRRSRVLPRVRGPVKLGPATVGPAPASSSRLQTSDLLALEEAKQWEVTGKRRRR